MKTRLPQIGILKAGMISMALFLIVLIPGVSGLQTGGNSDGKSSPALRPDYEAYGEGVAIKMEEVAQHTGFVFADVCALPFRDNYADVVVSRGSYQFWMDLEKGVSEILRILRSGGMAFVGRGVAPTMPEAEVRKLTKAGLIGGPKYNPDKDAERFRDLMRMLEIQQFEVIRHRPEDPNLNYGVWLYFRRP